MEPAYRAGDRVLVNRLAYFRHPPGPGDPVVLHDPDNRRRLLLKRVSHVDEAGRIHLLGDNAAESRDSRHFGPVKRSLILGKAWRKY